MQFSSKCSYQFPDGLYRTLCNQSYFAANSGEDDSIYFVLEDFDWDALFPHHPQLMVDYVCQQTDFPKTSTFQVEVQVDFTPQFYTRKITATSIDAAIQIAEDSPLQPKEEDDLVNGLEVAGWQVERMEGEE
jgi:hypothetical protein